MDMIDYQRLASSIDFYKKQGFIEIEAPWFVPQEIVDITIPKDRISFSVSQEDYLVGSAEQSFLYKKSKNLIENGYYQAITPCFRNEEEDTLHQKYFMKNELIIINPHVSTIENQLKYTIDVAESFFRSVGLNPVVVPTQDGFDIEHKGIELGSYGVRHHKIMSWIYGTGCAEPRTSIAKGYL